MPNHLAHESSPYLLQHQDNPVDWYPWGEEALEKARREEKPIFLSIGYSACHWCHVMEHESFENEAIARVLNENFVSIKVDREERPDLDQIYMNAVQMLTGRGGWPMSVFLTPDLKPFYGGTYWPPTGRQGMPGFDQILAAVTDAWTNRRDQAITAAEQLTAELQKVGATESGGEAGALSLDLIGGAVGQLSRTFDRDVSAASGRRRSFRTRWILQLLLAAYSRNQQPGLLDMVRLTLDRMAAGGIYDHLGGGFARYSVDARWLVPHFEKMLYDNALLARAYTDAYHVTGEANYARVVRETLDYVLRDMTDPGRRLLQHRGRRQRRRGRAVLHLDAGRDRSGARRGARGDVRPGVRRRPTPATSRAATSSICRRRSNSSAKLLKRTPEELAAELAAVETGAVRGPRRAGASGQGRQGDRRLERPDDRRAGPGRGGAGRSRVTWPRPPGRLSLSCARCGAGDGRLLHTWRGGKAKLDAYLDDYASLANALVTLYEATGDERWIDEAVRLADVMLEKFADPAGGGFFYTASDHEQLLTRTKELTDSSVPSGNALAATALLRLGKLLGRSDYLDAAEATLAAAVPILERAPMAAGQMLLALDRLSRAQPRIGAGRQCGARGDGSRPRRGRRTAVLAALRHGHADDGLSRVAASHRVVRRQGIARRRAGAVCLRELHLPGTGGRAGRYCVDDRGAELTAGGGRLLLLTLADDQHQKDSEDLDGQRHFVGKVGDAKPREPAGRANHAQLAHRRSAVGSSW